MELGSKDFPQVKILDFTTQPSTESWGYLGSIPGNFPTSLDEVDPEQAELDWQDQFQTQLNAPLEFVRFTFALIGVPRAFTHQLVRTRVGVSYAQESLRFAYKGGDGFDYDIGPSIRRNPEALAIYQDHMEATRLAYENLAARDGVVLEDARGVLPINIRTNIIWEVAYNTLLHVAGIRLCLQAQEQWRRVMWGIRDAILAEPELPDQLAYALQPVCYYSGRCVFRASFDRKCPIDSKLRVGSSWKIEDFAERQLT